MKVFLCLLVSLGEQIVTFREFEQRLLSLRVGVLGCVTPSALGCEECLRLGQSWVHLRICRACGHVGCCDSSPGRHATKHFHATRHPIIEGYDPPEGWGWCFVDEAMFDLSDRMTPHNGPIPRYY